MSTETIEFRASLRRASITHARKLIKSGDIKESARWRGPSSGAEDAYIEERGFLRYGDWFLGLDEEATPDTKGRFKYPFTDDFKTISINGLKAIRSRSAQNDEEDIFNAAGRLLDLIEKRGEYSSQGSEKRITFQMSGGEVDRDAATIRGVSILEAGEARGHRMIVTERTLATSMALLAGKVLPAYVTHTGAASDRLLDEVGAFQDFYTDGNKIRARFEALPSFQTHEPERFDRLFDLAEKMPATFGVSIVFEGSLFWETDEDDQPFDGFSDRPEAASFELPTISPARIFSADFVDTPAATASLFAEVLNDQPISEDMNAPEQTQLDESASAELERRRAADEVEEGNAPPAPAEEKPAKKKAKKKAGLDETPEEIAEEIAEELAEELEPEATRIPEAPELLDATLAELNNRIGERDRLITTQSERIAELDLENRAFRRALAGSEEMAAEGEGEEAQEQTPSALKDAAIKNYLEEHPTHNRITAILEVGKVNPEIFNN